MVNQDLQDNLEIVESQENLVLLDNQVQEVNEERMVSPDLLDNQDLQDSEENLDLKDQADQPDHRYAIVHIKSHKDIKFLNSLYIIVEKRNLKVQCRLFRDHKAHLEKVDNLDHKDNVVKLVNVVRLVNKVNRDHEENRVNLDHQASLDNQVLVEKTENQDLKVWISIFTNSFLDDN